MNQEALLKSFYDDKKNPCKKLLRQIRACDVCAKDLPLGPRPVLNFHPESKVLIVGQAPGTKVHKTGLPWNDPSGDRLRSWMDISQEEFYDVSKYAIVPMGYCYPGKGKSGDLPPRKECEELWLEKILASVSNVELVLVIGQYAHAYYIEDREKTLTETVRAWKRYTKKSKNQKYRVFPLPHPSPRNYHWLQKNPWFEKELIPDLRKALKQVL